ncbi:hypothetical protein C8K38_122100 [Rhodococcus sp. OK611]|uniref:hypothetical protein n=1 Tax=unclassified Rhodococcus (in: high G+C Gram-positive bacteria) TaxID=192944 RepID=UPI000BD0E244|nr:MULTISPECIES: hypothetical protein [unclassified Rhodococcus (in: high G+C Gram-positive bacteria)]PTR36936.1 hypothetical protein C8K38_122100 [Rhodococcus sp. OK611]SNX93667.1 hypothetical protein SAMN05447004_122101 [Rhodococcus sp. OK270]
MAPSPDLRTSSRAKPERIDAQDGFGSPEPSRGPGPVAIAAVVLALLGVAATAVAPVLGVIRQETGPAVAAAAVTALVCAALAPALAVLALVGRRPAVAGTVLAGAGGVSVGLVVLDLQLLDDPINANRLELFRPLTAASLSAGPGAYAILAGHVLVVLAGLLGLVAAARASNADGYGHSDYPDHDGAGVGRRIGAGLSVLAVAAAVVLAAALFAPPLRSTDPVLLVPAVIESAAPMSLGAGLVGVAVLIVVAAALAAISPLGAAGAIVGAAVAALGLVGVRLVAGLPAGDGVSVGPGSVVAIAACAVLIAVGCVIPAAAAARARRGLAQLLAQSTAAATAAPAAAGTTKSAARARAAAAERARVGRWHVATAVAGIVAGLLGAVGALLPVLSVPDGVPEPRILATRVVLLAGVVLVVACVWLLLSEFAGLVRPAVGVLWAAQVMAVAAALQAVVVAGDLPGFGPGPGAALLALSAVAAAATGLLALCAGSAERDGIDTSVELPVQLPVLIVGSVAALVSVAALGLPLYRGRDFGPDSFAQWPWGWDLWGRALLAVVIAAAVLVAARSRAARGASLMIGAVTGMSVYLMGWPLTRARVAEPAMGAGAVCGLVAVALLAVTAFMVVRRNRR